MGFLDKVRETAAKVSEKAEEAVATGKEKLEETKLRKRIGELKEQLGGLIYDQRCGRAGSGADAEVDRLVHEIREAEAALAELAHDGAGPGDTDGTPGPPPDTPANGGGTPGSSSGS